ncbi:MAG: nucleotidyltransferase domain-containing protein [Thermomicrobiales bacterium]
MKPSTIEAGDALRGGRLPVDVATVVEQVARVPGVKAVTLGGSRARGMARPDSDWDFGIYYRGEIETAAIRALGYPGHVAEPGDWGRIVNGGAWLQVDRERVDLLYRDLDVVEHWLTESEAGRFEIDRVGGHVAGLPTYVLAGELSLGTVLRGVLPHPTFSVALRRAAPPVWEGDATVGLLMAEGYAARGEAAICAGLLARAVLGVAHARLAARGVWALNEKGLIARAGLEDAAEILTAVGWTPQRLIDSVTKVRDLLRLERPDDLHLDRVVRAGTDTDAPPR